METKTRRVLSPEALEKLQLARVKALEAKKTEQRDNKI